MINILKSPSNRIGFSVMMAFQLTQHIRDELLMKNLIEYLYCGKVYKYKDAFVYKVYNLPDLAEKIIPLFQKYPIQGVKLLDYLDFVKVIELIKVKAHLTEEGLDQIIKIKAGMNTGRK